MDDTRGQSDIENERSLGCFSPAGATLACFEGVHRDVVGLSVCLDACFLSSSQRSNSQQQRRRRRQQQQRRRRRQQQQHNYLKAKFQQRATSCCNDYRYQKCLPVRITNQLCPTPTTSNARRNHFLPFSKGVGRESERETEREQDDFQDLQTPSPPPRQWAVCLSHPHPSSRHPWTRSSRP
jgi:hypothetical protein